MVNGTHLSRPGARCGPRLYELEAVLAERVVAERLERRNGVRAHVRVGVRRIEELQAALRRSGECPEAEEGVRLLDVRVAPPGHGAEELRQRRRVPDEDVPCRPQALALHGREGREGVERDDGSNISG